MFVRDLDLPRGPEHELILRTTDDISTPQQSDDRERRRGRQQGHQDVVWSHVVTMDRIVRNTVENYPEL